MRSPTGIVSLLLTTCLCACTAGPLHPDDAVEPHRTHLSEASNYARTTERVPAGPDASGGLHVALTHVDTPAEGRLFVCIHGVLSSGQAYRFVEGPLGRDGDLVVADLPGCGESDKPDFARIDARAYSPTWLARHLLRALDRFTRARGCDDVPIVLVGHSLGGAVALRAAADPRVRAVAPALAERIEGLVLISTPAPVIEAPTDAITGFARIDQPAVDVGRALGVFEPLVAREIRKSVIDPARTPLQREHQQMLTSLGCCEVRRAARGMLLRYNPLRADGSIDRKEGDLLHTLEARLGIPVLVIVGTHDQVVRPRDGRDRARRMPTADLVELPTRHSPTLEAPTETAEAIRAFVAGPVVADDTR